MFDPIRSSVFYFVLLQPCLTDTIAKCNNQKMYHNVRAVFVFLAAELRLNGIAISKV